jgi:hypothetical protein
MEVLKTAANAFERRCSPERNKILRAAGGVEQRNGPKVLLNDVRRLRGNIVDFTVETEVKCSDAVVYKNKSLSTFRSVRISLCRNQGGEPMVRPLYDQPSNTADG